MAEGAHAAAHRTTLAMGAPRVSRVAVIAVHGVADQQPGDTAKSVVDLLVASAPGGATYRAESTERFTVQVPPLAPAAAPPTTTEATPTMDTRPVAKALKQSFGSDFQRGDWQVHERAAAHAAAESASAPAAAAAAPAAPPSPLGPTPPGDRGIAVSNYLLAKHLRNGAEPQPYESARIRLERRGAGAPAGPAEVDVYEMYWADLSRLSGVLPRIVTELFTLVFRLSKLGRETVIEAWRQARDAGTARTGAWRALGWLQAALDWAFVNGLALLFAQLVLLVLIIVPFGLLAAHPQAVRFVAGIGALIVGLLWLLYCRREGFRALIGPGALALVGAVLLLAPGAATWFTGLLWLVLLTVLYDAGLRVAEDRFPFTRVVGLLLWAVVLVYMFGWLLDAGSGRPEHAGLVAWVQAAIAGSEMVNMAIKVWWMAVAPFLVAWLWTGVRAAGTGGYRNRGSVGTGRLGLFVSMASFLTLAMASWALLSTVLDRAVVGIDYTPSMFSIDELHRGTSDAARAAENCPLHPAEPPAPASATTPAPAAALPASAAASESSAQTFLRIRYEDTTAFFALVAAVLLLMVFYLAAVFVPSILAELKITARRDPAPAAADALAVFRSAALAASRRLGRWLTAGYRNLDLAVLLVATAGVVVSAGVAVLFATGSARGVLGPMASVTTSCIAWVSQAALKPLVLSAAGVAAALTALGGVLSRTLPSLRAPLDIALDVDNYLREFPRRMIPRARMYSRYAALLDHVGRGGYDRIVVVSHSQGTVISAEVLRLLGDAAYGTPGADRAARLRTRYGAEMRLLTLGCPLRQLYAARFPTLYGWVLAAHGAGNGPLASDIGVALWANAFTSGDYVGRWLWSSPAYAGDVIGNPMTDTLDPAAFGRTDAYSPFDPMPPQAHPLGTARELEVCLGAGAHTHYFEPDQADVAWLVEHLIAGDVS
jgi:hypothetical protein